MTRVLTGFLCVMFLLLTSCATEKGLREGLERSVKDYNRLLRWHEIENAGMTYIDQDLREEFLKRAEILKKRGLSVTDFRILSTRHIPESKSGDALAEFDYYLLPSNKIKTISYRQDWVYLEDIKSWKIKSGLPNFE